MRRRDLLRNCLGAGAAAALPTRVVLAAPVASGLDDRVYWLAMLQKVAHPVLAALSTGTLRASMPVEAATDLTEDRRRVTHLEAAGRTLAGIADWLESGPRTGAEGLLRARYAAMAREAIGHGVDPHSPDYLRFGEDRKLNSISLSGYTLRGPRSSFARSSFTPER